MNALSTSKVLFPQPTLAFGLFEAAGIARAIDIVFRTPFLGLSSVCCCTLDHAIRLVYPCQQLAVCLFIRFSGIVCTHNKWCPVDKFELIPCEKWCSTHASNVFVLT